MQKKRNIQISNFWFFSLLLYKTSEENWILDYSYYIYVHTLVTCYFADYENEDYMNASLQMTLR